MSILQQIKCFFGKHDFYNTYEKGYIEDYCEIASGYYAEVWKCIYCPTKKPGKVIK